MKKIILLVSLLAAMFATGIGQVGQTFVDWRGSFHFQYPDDWYEVDYRQVNIFLGMQGVSMDEFDYDVALAAKDRMPFWETVYVFVSSYTIGKLTDAEIDSALKDISSEYGTTCRHGKWSAGEYGLDLTTPVYDKSIRAVAVRDIFRGEPVNKMLLQMRVFHDRGIAVFNCYAPDSIYHDVEKEFFKLATSLSTENLHNVAPKESTQIVDLSQRDIQKPLDSEPAKTETASKPASGWLIIVLGLVILAAACYIILNKKKNK